MIKAVLFDMDGTILNTLTDLTNSVNYALEYMGYPTHTESEIGSFIGNGILKLMTRAVPEGEGELSIIEADELCCEYYKEHSNDNTAPYNGICELMDYLRENDIKIGIVSNKIHEAVLELNAKFFGIDVAIGEQKAYHRKPSGDMLIATMNELEVSPNETIYIGDTEVDKQTANNANCKSRLGAKTR